MEKPINIYMRLINYSGAALTTAGTHDTIIADVQNKLDIKNNQFIAVESYIDSVEQTLNIGSQSTGAGAGKITFNPFSISKPMDATSPALFQLCASGTPFKTTEIFFINKSHEILFKETYKLVAVKSISRSATSAHPSIMETISFQYGGLIITAYENTGAGNMNVLQNGWNAVKNISDNDTSIAIT